MALRFQNIQLKKSARRVTNTSVAVFLCVLNVTLIAQAPKKNSIPVPQHAPSAQQPMPLQTMPQKAIPPQTTPQSAAEAPQSNDGLVPALPGQVQPKTSQGAPKEEEKTDFAKDERGEVYKRSKKTVRPDMTSVVNEEIIRKRNVSTGFALFLGLDSGYMQSSPTDSQQETQKSGYQIGGKFLGSVYPENWVFDFGLGWFFSKIKGQEYVNDGSGNITNELVDVTILTQAAFLEIAPRYRLSENWQLGLALDVVFGTDLTFSARQQNTNPVGLIGGTLMYGVPEKTADLRYGVQLVTDITLANRQIMWAMFSIQMGLPILKPDIISKRRDQDTTRLKIQTVDDVKIKKVIQTVEVVKYVLETYDLPFAQRKANLQVDSQSFLLELAQALQSVSQVWGGLVVDGHVVNSGDEKFNHRLSGARAYAVRSAFTAGGIPSEKVQHRGNGARRPRDPADTTASSPKNDRTELTFSNVTDHRKLNDVISKLLARKRKPETCGQQGCK